MSRSEAMLVVLLKRESWNCLMLHLAREDSTSLLQQLAPRGHTVKLGSENAAINKSIINRFRSEWLRFSKNKLRFKRRHQKLLIDWKYFSRPLIIRFSSNLQHTPTVQFDQLRFVQISPQSMSQLSEIINAHIPPGLTKSWSRIILWSGEMQMKRSRNKRSNSKTFVNDSIITLLHP